MYPIANGAEDAPVSANILHVPKNSPLLLFGDKSAPKVSIKAVDRPLPAPAKIAIKNRLYKSEVNGIKNIDIDRIMSAGTPVNFLPHLSITYPTKGNNKESIANDAVTIYPIISFDNFNSSPQKGIINSLAALKKERTDATNPAVAKIL